MSKRSVIAVDTPFLIWGIQGIARPESSSYMVPRTRRFIAKLSTEDVEVLVPAPVLAEFLARVPTKDRPATLIQVHQLFRVEPFDAKAAMVAAELWDSYLLSDEHRAKQLADPVVGWRQKIKVDMQTVAIAVTRRVDVLYSQDADIQNFAQGRIKVLPIPDVPEQPRLFELEPAE